MTVDERIERYVENALALMRDDGFEILRDEEFDGQPFTAVAVARETGFIRSSNTEIVVFAFGEFRLLDRKKMRRFTTDAYDYTMENFPSRALVKIANGDIWCYPVAVAVEATDGIVRDVAETYPKTDSSHPQGYPIVFDASQKESFCFSNPNTAGAFLWMNEMAAKFDLIDPME